MADGWGLGSAHPWGSDFPVGNRNSPGVPLKFLVPAERSVIPGFSALSARSGSLSARKRLVLMSRSEEYRDIARECRAAAAVMSLHEDRDHMLRLAEIYARRADEVEQERTPRSATLERSKET